MVIIANAGGCEFKCVESHYPLIYRLKRTITNFRHYIKNRYAHKFDRLTTTYKRK